MNKNRDKVPKIKTLSNSMTTISKKRSRSQLLSRNFIRQINIVNKLIGNYPDAKIALNYASPWQLLVAVILSAQCTDITVNKITVKLFSKYGQINDYANIPIEELERDIRSAGFYRNKAKNIKASARIIIEKYHGLVPCSMEELLRLPGVARKTANIILSNACQRDEGIAVDTHVNRISQRLRLIDTDIIGGKNIVYFKKGNLKITDFKKDANTDKIETELVKFIPRKLWSKFTYSVIDHGRAICKAQNPKCPECFLRLDCPVARN